MKWKMKTLALAVSWSVLTACASEQSQVQSPAAETPAPSAPASTKAAAESATPEAAPKATPKATPTPAAKESVKPELSMSGRPAADQSAWIGEWEWQQTTKYDVSTITIHSVKNRRLIFSLNAFHVINHKTMDGHIGEIDRGTAVLDGNKAVFRDDETNFELRMTLVDEHLEVATTGEGYFGAFVTVDGSYSRKKNDYLIVPGRSVGKISLGMTKDEVTKLLGKPAEADESRMTYKSAKNSVSMIMNDNNVVKQIEFTSDSFSTAEGINLGNFQQRHEGFAVSQFQWRFLQLRYEREEGGLAFYSFNADVPDDNEEYQAYVRGYVYEGRHMFEEPITGVEWEPME